MPIHDWTRVDAGLFHHFHQQWTGELCDELNAGGLPAEYFALVEQKIPGPSPDVLTLKLASDSSAPRNGPVGLAVADVPPRARLVSRTATHTYATKANLVTVRHRHGDVVAVIEVISPGNKASAVEFQALIDKLIGFIQQGVHLLVVDLFPPTRRDPQGVHKALWDNFIEDEAEEFSLHEDGDRTLVAYSAGIEVAAYVETIRVGDALPGMPIFLRPDFYVPAPLEKSYQGTWARFPDALKGLLAPSSGRES
ncbi:MAG: DUF4058 family protein [Pirellulales bacterium]